MANHIRKFTFIVLLVCMLFVASGCAGNGDGGPSLIGVYPSSRDYDEYIVPLPDPAVVVYHAMIDMRVRSISKAFEEIKDLAYEYGGFITTAQIWYEDRDENATVVVSAPVYNFDLIYDEIMRIGTIESETIRGELDPYPGYGHDEWVMSTITINLSERSSLHLPEFPDWHAANTFRQAFGVVAVIFRFLFDAAIWIVVVLGPFALIGWVARKLWQGRQIPNTRTEEENNLDKEI